MNAAAYFVLKPYNCKETSIVALNPLPIFYIIWQKNNGYTNRHTLVKR